MNEQADSLMRALSFAVHFPVSHRNRCRRIITEYLERAKLSDQSTNNEIGGVPNGIIKEEKEN